MKKAFIAVITVSILLLLAGFFVPLGSRTFPGCGSETASTVRLHLIKGDSLEEAERNHRITSPLLGCPATAKYTLYVL